MKVTGDRWRDRLACTIPPLLIAASALADGTPVQVKLEGSQGQGLAFMRGVDCYVVTAAHVLKKPVGIFVVGSERRTSQASRLTDLRNEGWDIAVLKVNQPAQVCRADYYTPVTRLDKLLQQGLVGTLRLRSDAGDEDTVSVSVISWDEREVRLRAPPGTLYESLSGGAVYVGDQRVAMLVTVPIDESGLARAIRFDRIAALTQAYLRLDPPTSQAALLDDQVAMELFHARLNFVESGEFCESLYRNARWTYEREPKLQYRERRSGTSPVYVVDSLMVPTADSEVTFADKEVTISTKIARVPSTMDVKPFWDRTIRATNKCLSAMREVKNLGFRRGPQEMYGSKYWDIDYRNNWGMSMRTITIWLDFTGTELEIRMTGRK